MDTWAVSTFRLLWIMLLRIWVYKHLLMSLLSILWGIYPEVELLDPMVIRCLLFWGTARLLFAVAPHSSTLAWKIPWMEEPGGLPSMGSHRVGHDWRDLAAAAAVLLPIHQGYIWSSPFRPILWQAWSELKAQIEGNILKQEGLGWRATRGLSENVGGTIRRCLRK